MAGNDAAHPFQEDFLQTIKEVHWGVGAVVFSEGSVLGRTSLNFPDNGKFSMSTWRRVPIGINESLNNSLNILEIADHAHEDLSDSRIILTPSGGAVTQVVVGFQGAILFDPLSGTAVQPTIGLRAKSTLSLPYGKWFHFFTSVSWDFTDTELNYAGPWLFNLWVNGKDVADYNQPSGFGPPVQGRAYSGPGGFGDPHHAITGGVGIKVNGCQLGMPIAPAYRFPAFGKFWPAHEHCDTQIWFGKYIDPAVHIGKFFHPLQAKDDKTKFSGRRVDTKVAAAAFGKPSFLFKGGAKTYVKNAGSGGEVTEYTNSNGSPIKNFTPAPPSDPK